MAVQYYYNFQEKFWDYKYHYLEFKAFVTKLITDIEYAEVLIINWCSSFD